MNERSKGLLVLLGSAAAAGVFIEVTRDRDPSPSTPTASASASTAPAPRPVPTAPAVTRAGVEQAIAQLDRGVRVPAGDPKSPWALAHGLIAFGKDFQTQDGKSAVQVIGSFARSEEREGAQPLLFPDTVDDQPVEPHPHLLVKTFLDVDVPLDTRLQSASGKTYTVERLVNDMRAVERMPETDTDWHNIAWLMAALVESTPAGEEPSEFLRQLTAGALTRLEQDQRVCTEYSGPLDEAFDPGSPLRAAKQEKTGIFGHSCGGLHLVQAVIAAVTRFGNDQQKARLRAQLGVLIFRYESERAALLGLLEKHPDQGLLLRVQQLKLFGHLVETLTLARQLKAYDPSTEGGRKLDETLRATASDTVRVARELSSGGVFQRLDPIRAQRKQTYLDLIGDSCHAIRGLRRALELNAIP